MKAARHKPAAFFGFCRDKTSQEARFRRLSSAMPTASDGLNAIITGMSGDLEAQKMFVRKFLVSLLFAAIFAEALAALADYAAVESAASMSTVGAMTVASDASVF